MTKQPNKELQTRVEEAAQAVLERDGRISYSELFIQLGILTRQDFMTWRTGQVPFLERVVQGNLMKLARMRTALRRFARARRLQRVILRLPRRVRFSKSGFPAIEEEYRALYALPRPRKEERPPVKRISPQRAVNRKKGNVRPFSDRRGFE